MNFTSASVNRMPARSEASAAEMERLGSPGAPGCTMGGCCVWPAATPNDTNATPASTLAAASGVRRYRTLMRSPPANGGRQVPVRGGGDTVALNKGAAGSSAHSCYRVKLIVPISTIGGMHESLVFHVASSDVWSKELTSTSSPQSGLPK